MNVGDTLTRITDGATFTIIEISTGPGGPRHGPKRYVRLRNRATKRKHWALINSLPRNYTQP